MIKKKSKKDREEQPETKVPEMQQDETEKDTGEPVADQKTEDPSTEKVNELEEKLRKQIEELRDTNLRLHAEFDNYRKRSIKERIEMSKTASEEVIVDLLPVLDDFERALQNFDNKKTSSAFLEGIQLIYNKLAKTLSNKGLDEIQAMGQAFDTDYHEAISNVPAENEKQKDKIIDVVQKGYKLHGKVIRFAKVIVGT
jgi:molecular chaperone GrpE